MVAASASISTGHRGAVLGSGHARVASVQQNGTFPVVSLGRALLITHARTYAGSILLDAALQGAKMELEIARRMLACSALA